MNLGISIISNNLNFMMAKKSKNITDRELLDCIYQGIPKKEIQQRYNLTEPCLDMKLLQLNLPRTTLKLKHLYLEKRVEKLMSQGKNISETCDELGIKKYMYYKFIRRLKLKNKMVYSADTNIGRIILRQNELKKLVAQERTMKEMADYFGVNIGTINSALRKLDISTKHMERIYELKKKQIVEYLQKYKTINNAAEELKISTNTLRKYIDSFNITKQNLGGIRIWR